MEWILGGIAATLVIIAVAAWRPIRNSIRETRFKRADQLFHRQRERLEAKFYEIAASSGRPRGLRWTNIDFQDAVSYARDRRSGGLTAFVSVAISFEAVEGGGMEEVAAVSNIRAATAVFHYERDRWQTYGRALFNLNPTEAIQRYHNEFELVE